MDFSGCSNDLSIGPTVQGCRADFDFTIKFEKIFLSIIPATVFIGLSFPRIVWLCRKPTIVVRGKILQSVKLTALVSYAALQFCLLILSSTQSGRLTALFVASGASDLAAALSMLALSFLEHLKSPRPSMLLNAFLFLTLLLDIAQTRTLWLASVGIADVIFSRIFTASTAMKTVLIMLESQHKSRWLQWDAKQHSPEETSGLYGLGAFIWLNRLFLAGFNKLLTMDDLFPLDEAMRTECLQGRLLSQLETHSTSGDKFGLAKALVRVLSVPFLLVLGPSFARMGFLFCQPFLINSLLNYLQESPETRSANTGYGLIGATLIIYPGIAISTAFYEYYSQRSVWMIRGALSSCIYRKATQARRCATDDLAALTLMSADVEYIQAAFSGFSDTGSAALQVALSAWLLSRQLGVAVVGPIVTIVLSIFVLAVISTFSGKMQEKWMEKLQNRIGLTANAISNMKHLKISGLSAPVEALVQRLRLVELRAGEKFRLVMLCTVVMAFVPSQISPVMAFVFTRDALDITRIFTSISFLMLLTDPLVAVFQGLPVIIAGVTCLSRVQTYLEQDPRYDFRESSFSRVSSNRGCLSEGEFSKTNNSYASAMRIAEGSFGWEEGRLTLRDIELQIPQARLTMVVGPIASGKSTLCNVLLGEVPVFRGHVFQSLRSGLIGYCDQVPFLFNSTIRENIVGFSPYDQARYNEVVEATMLAPDLAALPRGDLTRAGSNGICLSGGQKQRVSMARSLYLETQLYIFDDILSGLDSETENQVFSRVFGPNGLLRRRNATAILCTHSIRHIPAADHIIVLGTNGVLVEQGSFPDLVSNGKYVQNLGVKAVVMPEEEKNASLAPSLLKELAPLEESRTNESYASSHVNLTNRQIGDSTVYKHYLKSMNIFVLLGIIVSATATGFLSNYPQIWLNYWSSDVMSLYPSHPKGYWLGLYALFRVLLLLSMSVLCYFVLTKMIMQTGSVLHQQALRTVISAPLKFLTKTDAGVVTNLFSQDMTLVDGDLPLAILNLVAICFIIIGMAVVVATSSPFIATSYPFLVLFLWTIQKFYLRTSRQLRLMDLEAKSPLYTHFTDTLTSIATIRAFGWVDDCLNFNNRLLDDSQRPAYLLAMVQRWLNFSLDVVVSFLAALVVILATQIPSNTRTGFTGASLVTLMSFGSMISSFVRSYIEMEVSIGAVSRIKSFSEKVPSEDLPGEDLIPPKSWPCRGDIEIKAVSASYEEVEPGLANKPLNDPELNLALKELDVTIRQGEKVAIFGRSGSGKSSLVLLLLRLLEPLPSCSENITIDDVPLHRIDRSTLRQRIIAMSQDAVFLPDGSSFKANLDSFNDCDDTECRSVLEAVGMWAFVEERGGLSAGIVSETLSQGQKQLFSLARSILRRRVRAREEDSGGRPSEKGGCPGAGGILLLDEVSSSVDKDADVAMHAIIQREFEGYTIIMVSHRLDAATDFDRVIVMDRGRVAEMGTPQELVQREGSAFKVLWDAVHNGQIER